MLERIEESGALRTTLEQRFQALRDADIAKGEEQGLETMAGARAAAAGTLGRAEVWPRRGEPCGWASGGDQRCGLVGGCRHVDSRLRNGQRAARAAAGNRLARPLAQSQVVAGAKLMRIADCRSKSRSTGCGPYVRTPSVPVPDLVLDPDFTIFRSSRRHRIRLLSPGSICAE